MGNMTESGHVSEEVGGRSHLHQRLLHGSPIGHSPSTLQDKVRVYVTFGLAIFRQGFPLVQFLRAPRTSGSHKQMLSYQQIPKGRGQSFISIPLKEKHSYSTPREEWASVKCQVWYPASSTCPPEETDPGTQELPTTQPKANTQSQQRRRDHLLILQQIFSITQDFKTFPRFLFALYGDIKKVAKFPFKNTHYEKTSESFHGFP